MIEVVVKKTGEKIPVDECRLCHDVDGGKDFYKLDEVLVFDTNDYGKIMYVKPDWEQRRYEIAKEIYPTMLEWQNSTNATIRQEAIKWKIAALNAVSFADSLIDVLKK